ncbi:MAG: phosphatase PAP2 family protein [Bacteroidota bacterium]
MMKSADQFQKFLLWAIGGVLSSVVLAAIIIPKGNDVLWINGNHNEFSDRFFTFITYGGDGKIFIPLILITLFIRFSFSIAAISAWVGHGLLCSLLKRFVFPTMLRPTGTLDNDLLHFVPGVDVHTNYSFPSGHTATAFCFAILLALLVKRRSVFFVVIAFAILVAYSRIYLLQHFLVDVVGGAFIGTAVALIAWQLFENYGKAEWLSRRLEIQVKRNTSTRVSPR